MSAFSEFLAGRVVELERQLVLGRKRENNLRFSRDLWRTRALNEPREGSLWRKRPSTNTEKNQPAAAGPGLGSETGGRKEVTV